MKHDYDKWYKETVNWLQYVYYKWYGENNQSDGLGIYGEPASGGVWPGGCI